MTQTPIQRHNQTVLASLEKGDLVEFPRFKGIYSHWAVYVGDNNVVHLTGDPNAQSSVNANPSHVFYICGVMYSKAKVQLDNFFAVAAKSKARKNNNKDIIFSPDDTGSIVQRALNKIGDDIGYHILWKNCEYFASWCRYGEGWSNQRGSLYLKYRRRFSYLELKINIKYKIYSYLKYEEISYLPFYIKN
ncbi:hypothetical protein ACJMK2_034725 [Sinanodonta woodiana]|uniref:LRAT domain-containing protein n=1 Tax=Sinanodonta woodiana TaxID=1069815 RepID=A0ABD3WTZ5_SINWO